MVHLAVKHLDAFDPKTGMQVLWPAEREIVRNMRNINRKTQWLAIRYLAYKVLGLQQQIQYKGRAPYIENHYISITHNAEFAAIALSNQPIGIDLESLNRNYRKLAPKFASEEEFDQSNEALALIWTAKEAIYKLWQKGNLNFKKQIRINLPNKIANFGRTDAKLLCCNKSFPITITYYRLGENMLTIAQFTYHEHF